MKRLALAISIFVASISILIYNTTSIQSLLRDISHSVSPLFSNTIAANITTITTTITTATAKHQQQEPMLRNTMTKALHHAKITPHRSAARGHSDHGWLDSYHSYSFAQWYNPKFNNFGSLRVLNEDRVRANTGFPTHPHRDYEIFSYILSGELTHRDSMLRKGAEGGESEAFKRLHRGDVQFTAAGKGVAHSEFNEHPSDTVHFLQIWATPWKRGLTPRYHIRRFSDDEKRRGFLNILSPLQGGPDASPEQETAAEPVLQDTIPIHADFVMGAGLIAPGSKFEWNVGANASTATKRKVYLHVAMTQGGKAKIKLDGRDDAVLEEGDGAFVEAVHAGDKLIVESVGSAEAEVVVLDTA